MTEEEIAELKEALEEKKKLITTLRNKPWKMKKKMEVLKYGPVCTMSHCLFKYHFTHAYLVLGF